MSIAPALHPGHKTVDLCMTGTESSFIRISDTDHRPVPPRFISRVRARTPAIGRSAWSGAKRGVSCFLCRAINTSLNLTPSFHNRACEPRTYICSSTQFSPSESAIPKLILSLLTLVTRQHEVVHYSAASLGTPPLATPNNHRGSTFRRP